MNITFRQSFLGNRSEHLQTTFMKLLLASHPNQNETVKAKPQSANPKHLHNNVPPGYRHKNP